MIGDVAGGLVILILVVAATMLSVTFATRGAMATNKPVIEVLHFVGAKNGFIAGHFQRQGEARRRKGQRVGLAADQELASVLPLELGCH